MANITRKVMQVCFHRKKLNKKKRKKKEKAKPQIVLAHMYRRWAETVEVVRLFKSRTVPNWGHFCSFDAKTLTYVLPSIVFFKKPSLPSNALHLHTRQSKLRERERKRKLRGREKERERKDERDSCFSQCRRCLSLIRLCPSHIDRAPLVRKYLTHTYSHMVEPRRSHYCHQVVGAVATALLARVHKLGPPVSILVRPSLWLPSSPSHIKSRRPSHDKSRSSRGEAVVLIVGLSPPLLGHHHYWRRP